jgi:hypothetical protein
MANSREHAVSLQRSISSKTLCGRTTSGRSKTKWGETCGCVFGWHTNFPLSADPALLRLSFFPGTRDPVLASTTKVQEFKWFVMSVSAGSTITTRCIALDVPGGASRHGKLYVEANLKANFDLILSSLPHNGYEFHRCSFRLKFEGLTPASIYIVG